MEVEERRSEQQTRRRYMDDLPERDYRDFDDRRRPLRRSAYPAYGEQERYDRPATTRIATRPNLRPSPATNGSRPAPRPRPARRPVEPPGDPLDVEPLGSEPPSVGRSTGSDLDDPW